MSSTVAITRASRYGSFRPYKLRATGGFSDVYLARDNTGKTAALKVYRSLSNDTSNSMERFRREKAILERVASRRVARLIDADLDASPPWIASEYVDGPTLREAVTQLGTFQTQAALSVLGLLAETLNELHSLGIAHRDLSPNNIILSADGPTLIDFGSAQLLTTERAGFSNLSVGTPGYMSPEQLDGKPATLASDIYSFGKIALFLIGGDSASTDVIATNRFTSEQQALLRRCLNEIPESRPSSADLRQGFAQAENPIPILDKLQLSAPELHALPRGRTTTISIVLSLVLSVLVGTTVWTVTKDDPITSQDVQKRLRENAKELRTDPTEIVEVRGQYGMVQSIDLPKGTKFFRERRNLSHTLGHVDIFVIEEPSIISSQLILGTIPSTKPLAYPTLASDQDSIPLSELGVIGSTIAFRVSSYQTEFVNDDCPLEAPLTAIIEPELRRIRHVAAAPVCIDVLDSTLVAYTIHDWYPDKNLIVELAGWIDVAFADPIQILNSLQFNDETPASIVLADRPLSLSEFSTHGDQTSIIDNDNYGGAFFYATGMLQIPPRTSLSFSIKVQEDSPTQLSFHAFKQTSADEWPDLIPAGRLWATTEHQLRLDNPDSTPIVLAVEIDGYETNKPEISLIPSPSRSTIGWITSRSLALDLNAASMSDDGKIRFLLPSTSDYAPTASSETNVGDLKFPVPATWSSTTSKEMAAAGLRELWTVDDTNLREVDMPHLLIQTESFAKQLQGDDGTYWIYDENFYSCDRQRTYTHTALRSVSWTVYHGCGIPDAIQARGYDTVQSQAAPLIKFAVYQGTDTEADDASVIYRGLFVPGTNQDLDYFRELLTHLANVKL